MRSLFSTAMRIAHLLCKVGLPCVFVITKSLSYVLSWR